MTRLPEEEGPTFEPTTHYCARHLEAFRKDWPNGWGLAMMALFEEAMRRQEILRAAGWLPAEENGGEARGGDPRMLDRVLREYAPLCCYLGDETAARWAKLALGPVEEFKAALDALRAGPAVVDYPPPSGGSGGVDGT